MWSIRKACKPPGGAYACLSMGAQAGADMTLEHEACRQGDCAPICSKQSQHGRLKRSIVQGALSRG